MKPLELKIKKVFLKQIISGEKKEEYREPSNFNMVRLFNVDHANKRYTDKEGLKQIKFVAGYSKDADYAIVNILGIWINKSTENAMITIDLGDVVEHKLT